MGAVCLAAVAISCGSGESDGTRPDGPAFGGELVVFAASSLTDAFGEIAARFEERYPGTTVRLSFASSAALAVQIDEGAEADVFASADLAQMEALLDRGQANDSMVFATNAVVVVTPGNGKVGTFEDLAETGVRLVLAAKDVPIGRYAREVLSRASAPGSGIAPDFERRVLANLRSEETSARAVLAKVILGEADAGMVYRSDALAGGRNVRSVAVPAAFNVVARYPITVVTGTGKRDLAVAWIGFVMGSEGQEILVGHGFGAAK